jgi:amino acid transporter
MDIETVTRFFMWCTILNLGLLALTSIVCIFFADFSFRMNHKYFSISRETFNVVIVSFIGLYKIVVIVFNIVPYVALLIIG